MAHYDVIVCGAGIEGLWTAKYLAEQKKKVLLLEQFSWPHKKGSSHGDSRIVRYAHHLPHHTALMKESFPMWLELEKSSNQKLFLNCGLLLVSDSQQVKIYSDIMKKHGYSYENLNANQISDKIPGINLNDLTAVLDKSAGILKASVCLQVLKKAFESSGGVFHDSEKVKVVHPLGGNFVEVMTDKRKYTCTSIVLTCGAWITKLLKPLENLWSLEPQKIKKVHWKCENPRLYHISQNFPAVVFLKIIDDVQRIFYSKPVMEQSDLMEFTCHFGVPIEDPDNIENLSQEKKDLEIENDKKLLSMVENHLPNLHQEPALVESCIYTMTPDEDFILDHHPLHENVVIGAGFSGVGFKFSPVVGQILGNLALQRKPTHPLYHFAISRFISSQKV